MQIISNDSIALQEFYRKLQREHIDANLKETQIEGAMGIIPTIEIKSSDFTMMIKEIFIAWIEYKKFKLYVDSKEISKEEFDKINEESKIEIKFDEC